MPSIESLAIIKQLECDEMELPEKLELVARLDSTEALHAYLSVYKLG